MSSVQVPSTRVPQTKSSVTLPSLSRIQFPEGSTSNPPIKRIHSDADVSLWKQSKAKEHVVLFVSRLCESAVGKATILRKRAEVKDASGDNIDKIWLLLDELQHWTEEIEPLKTPQRYGNLAFRTWGERLEKRVSTLHSKLLPPSLHGIIPELEAYLLGSFGSWVRLDYGSGHELSFAAWLCFLSRLGYFDRQGEKFEERLALEIFPKYLEVAWGIQDRYGLEPAGSHGVWGLDDYQFIPYAIGASQLRDQIAYPPIAVTSVSHKADLKPASANYLLAFTPSSSPLQNTQSRLGAIPGPPFANLYTSSIARIHALKRGPFHEHSPILHDVASTVPNWVKVHSGMMKMWEAECLDKRPVVQHFPFGRYGFPWPVASDDHSQNAISSAAPNHTSQAQAKSANLPMQPTAAPWAKPSTGGPPMAPTGAPWALASSASRTGIPGGTATPTTRSTLASSGSAAAATSPFGILPKAGVPRDQKRDLN
ncbi:Phosphotyrosyl phosphatase activator [Meira miltonrushii]|uniref:Serine/threonine-protein phosphatase 2A activator n=1 Tax=Meira miltonrushii TaxID=1280837 RepID=A0A316VC66_9BASI|nr:Phosphotyrosyl phosphatase activator [Meira miltonrushii]PWN35257.1 Phosphotyrosyl phosphatase activator [Meira miltonrushii]